MAITLLAGTGSETSCAWPSHQADDWGILFVETSSGTVTTPTGCTLVGSIAAAAGTTSMFVYRIKATSGAMPDLALAGGSNHLWGVIIRARGVHLTDPIHDVGFGYATAATTTGFTPSIKSTYNNAKVLMALGWALDNAGPQATGWANASLTNVTEEYDAGTVTNDGGGITIASGDLATAGMTGVGTATISSGMVTSCTLTLRPADAASTFTVAGTATIAGSPAVNGATVYVINWTDALAAGYITSTTVAGGSGAFTTLVNYNGANSARTLYDDGSSYGCSPLSTPA